MRSGGGGGWGSLGIDKVTANFMWFYMKCYAIHLRGLESGWTGLVQSREWMGLGLEAYLRSYSGQPEYSPDILQATGKEVHKMFNKSINNRRDVAFARRLTAGAERKSIKYIPIGLTEAGQGMYLLNIKTTIWFFINFDGPLRWVRMETDRKWEETELTL